MEKASIAHSKLGSIRKLRKLGSLLEKNRSLAKKLKLMSEENASLRLELARIKEERERWERMATSDPLTRLKSKVLFMGSIEQAFSEMVRNGGALSLIIFDLDSFKEFNDTYGHLAGDMLLAAVGKEVKSRLKRVNDAGFRIGGDEFAILLPGAPLDYALELATSLLDCILSDSFRQRAYADILSFHVKSGLNLNRQAMQIGASFGVASANGELIRSGVLYDSHCLIALADKAMYAAKKRNGGKMVYFFHQDALRGADLSALTYEQATAYQPLYRQSRPNNLKTLPYINP